MSNWIEVNGARIEKEFFDGNVREAKDYVWMPIQRTDLRAHVHCLICGLTLGPGSAFAQARAYKAKDVYVCSY